MYILPPTNLTSVASSPALPARRYSFSPVVNVPANPFFSLTSADLSSLSQVIVAPISSICLRRGSYPFRPEADAALVVAAGSRAPARSSVDSIVSHVFIEFNVPLYCL
ncbi:hypothetical protein D3C74_401920 [compost metagenome]